MLFFHGIFCTVGIIGDMKNENYSFSSLIASSICIFSFCIERKFHIKKMIEKAITNISRCEYLKGKISNRQISPCFSITENKNTYSNDENAKY